MNNIDVEEFLTQECQSSSIERLVWIAAARNSEINDLLELTSDNEIESLFPGIPLEENDFAEGLRYAGRLGFLARVYMPIPINVRFKNDNYENGEVVGYGVGGAATIVYAYAETTEDLLQEIKKGVEPRFEYYIKKEREKCKKLHSKIS